MKATLRFNGGALPRCIRWLLIPLFSFTFLAEGFSQQTLTTIGGWNAYVHLPDDYNTTGSKTYPVIFFFPGTGQVGTDASQLLVYGPGYFLASGWNGYVTDPATGATVKPIIISLQPPALWPNVGTVDGILTTAIGMYRIDHSRITLTGLSMGGWISEMYVMQYPTKIAAVVAMTAVTPTDNPAYPTPFATYAQDCGHWLGYEQINDFRDMLTIANTMNAAVPGSAVYFQTDVGGGGHCCWNTWYDPSHTDSYSINGKNGNWNIYQFLVSYSGCSSSSSTPPTVSAGTAQSITLPASTVTLTGTATGNGGATIGSSTWTQVSGPNTATITTASALSTAVTGLVAGSYVFQLSATDNNSQTSTSTVTITVNPAVVLTPPTVSAGTAQSITLPVSTVTLTGTATGNGGATVGSSTWTQVSGPNTATITTASALSTTVTGLVAGSYVFQLSATDNNSQTSTSTVTVTVYASGDCGCDFTLSPPATDGQLYLDGTSLGVKPGNKVCLKAAHYVSVYLFNFYGAPGNPITIVNCGGPVTISGYNSYGFILSHSWYVHVTGSGDPNTKYGIQIDGGPASTSYGYSENGHVRDIEVDHFEVKNIAGVGMGCAPTPSCDSTTWSVSWKMYNISFHDNYVHHTTGEGYYIGNTQYDYTYSCSFGNVDVHPQQIDSVKFYNNWIDSAGWTAAQISQVTGGVDIHDNLVTNYGWMNKPQHQAGIIVGEFSQGRVYRNKIMGGTGDALQYFGNGVTTVYNNIFANAGWDGTAQGQPAVFVDDRVQATGYPPLHLNFINNTIVNPARNGISFYNDNGTVDQNNIIANNIIAGPGIYSSLPAVAYFDLQANPHADTSHNLGVPTIAPLLFLNAAGNDYHLLSGSPAIDAGMNVAAYGVTGDMEGNARPYGSAYDIGAYEFTNQPPPLIANAGGNQTIALPQNKIVLDASKSVDPAGSITGYTWVEISGPNSATIANTATVNTSVSGLQQGVYKFSVTITDTRGLTASDTMTLTVNAGLPPSPPTANAGSAQTLTLPRNYTTLNGSASSDASGTITGYTWSQVSGPNTAIFANLSTVITTISGLVQGTYVFQLKVTDNNGLSSTATVTITVNSASTPPTPPTANAGAAQAITLPNNVVTLNGSGSSDPSGTITGYAWTEVSGPNAASLGSASGVSTTAGGLVQGTYVFQLTVTDNNGLSGTANVTVTVYPAPMPPVANPGPAKTITLPTNAVALNGSGSTDASGTITSYQWTQVSGPTTAQIGSPSGISTNIDGLVQGTYVFQLKVSDNTGQSGTATVTITVNAALTPPVANAGQAQTITLPTNSVTLNGSGSTDASGTISGYAWTQVSGPSAATFGSASGVSTTAGGLVQGVYVFQLKVTDNNSLSSTATVTITVNAAVATVNQPPVANAGPDQHLNNSATTNLSGAASYDPDGTIVKYQWSQVSGAGGVTVANSASANAIVFGLQPGNYIFQLTVTDNNGATATATVTLYVTSGPSGSGSTPYAVAGSALTIPSTQSTAQLNGSASYDVGGTLTGYSWVQMSGPGTATIANPTQATTSIGQLVPGTYTFQLMVTDNNGNTATDTVSVTVMDDQRHTSSTLQVYPNPFTTQVNVVAVNSYIGTVKVNIYQGMGQLVQSMEFVKTSSTFSQTIALSGLARGTYFMQILFAGETKPETIKLVKQ